MSLGSKQVPWINGALTAVTTLAEAAEQGFKGDMDIDQFCVDLELAHHQAVHGGGNWRLGRTWPGEWNRKIMGALRDAETAAGRMLTRREILDIVARYMKEYGIPINFTRWRGR